MIGLGRHGLRKFDMMLFFSVLCILCIGLATLFSATMEYHAKNIVFRQVIWISFGLILLLMVLGIDYRKIISLSYFFYAITIFLLIFVLFLGETRGGAKRWINLGVFNLQPSEIAKVTLILTLATYMGRKRDSAAGLGFICGAFLLMLPVFLLILIEPDLGTALLFLPVTFVMLFIAGARIKYLIGLVVMGLSGLPFFWHFLRDYQKQRLFVFINPNIDPLGSGYTIIQSKIAVGSGGLFGKGWLAGTQSQLNFLPERHTDFIFSVVGEEWGFLGALVLVLLYALIVYKGIKIGEATTDLSGRLVATGFITLFAVQVLTNVGMTIGFLPIVGLTLPLISYGGSSLMTTLVYIGVLLNIGMRRPVF